MKATLRSTLLLCIALLGATSIYSAPEAPATKPTVVRAPLPEYPDALRAERITGTVILAVSIDEKGVVQSCSATNSTDKRFEASAIEAVRKWRFKPATRNNTPIASQVTLPISFSLDS